jgi:hypothetical protein
LIQNFEIPDGDHVVNCILARDLGKKQKTPPTGYYMPRVKSRIIAKRYATPHQYDVIIYTENNHYYAKDRMGNLVCVDSQTACIQESIDYLARFGGNKIYIKSGIYDLNNNPVNINNLSNIIIDGDKPTIQNTVITLYGQQWNYNMHNIIRNIIFRNSSLVIQNGFMNLFEDLEFYGGQTQIRLQNTTQWSEANWFRNISLFDPGSAAFVFDTPTGTGASSYANNRLDNIFINLYRSGSKGIVVNNGATLDNVYMSNIRIWAHADGIVGLYINGDTDNAKIYNIVFESFVQSPTSLYGIFADSGTTVIPIMIKPIFLGNWTSYIYNPYYRWIIGQVLGKSTVNVPVGTNNTYGQPVYIADYLRFYGTIPTPRIKITWGGTFAPGETVTVKITFHYIDGGQSSITKSATAPGSYWLTYDDLLNLYPGNDMLQSITAQAMSSASSTQVTVTIDAIFG